MIATLHSSLGNRVRPHLKKEKSVTARHLFEVVMAAEACSRLESVWQPCKLWGLILIKGRDAALPNTE